MKLYHVTPRANKSSILENGLLRSYSRVATRELFFVPRAEVSWAVEHVRLRHGVNDIAVLYVNVRSRQLRRMGFYHYALAADVAPRNILGELAWEE